MSRPYPPVSPRISSVQGYNTSDGDAHYSSAEPNGKPYHSSITHYASPDDDNGPPPLLPKRCVPLPALSPGPVLLNPILAHSLTQPSIAFDLSQPSSTAILSTSPSSNTVISTASWRHQPAMYPATSGSMTLRLTMDDPNCPIWRPITVFPISPFDSVVTIDDVLKAVSHAVCMAVREGRLNRPRLGSCPSKSVYDAFRNDCVVWWGGLYPSTTEREVWMLDTRHELRSCFQY